MAVAPSDNLSDPRLRTEEPLLWLVGAGHQVRTDESYYYNSRKRTDRPQMVVQYTLAGTGFYHDERGRTELPAGWAWVSIIPGEFEYGFAPHTFQPYEFTFVCLDGSEVLDWYQRLTQSFGHVMNLGTEGRIGPMILALAHAKETGRLPDRYVQSAMVYQLLMEIFSTANRARLDTSPRVTQALRLISEHAGDADFGIAQLAVAMDCSREHVTRLFRAAIGVSPIDYLTQQRLRRAADALRSSGDKLELIARRCGFTNANYFCRAFREHVGTTPAKFRKQPWLTGP